MNQLITDQGQEVCDEKESIEIGKFYQKLYIKKEKKRVGCSERLFNSFIGIERPKRVIAS